VRRLLIANRGEIAIRIARAAADEGLATVGVFSVDDAEALHVRRVDRAEALRGVGPSAYLDAAQLVDVAVATGCDAVHPGYGFLSESPDFARRCEDAGLLFVGPTVETLTLLGDKARARAFAASQDVAVLAGTNGPTSLGQADAFLHEHGGGIVVKAVHGGGGRGMRVVETREALHAVWERCQAEAEAAFGSGELLVEQLLRPARHVEVQVVGDGTGAVTHLFERDCTLQRRHQKLVEIAPAPGLSDAVRDVLTTGARRLAAAARYRGVGTFEFLVEPERARADDPADACWFIEANPRLQVEHTVTEEVTGVDLVRTQLRIAAGARLSELGLDVERDRPRGIALQVRVNTEMLHADGAVRPTAGTLSVFTPPTGPGVRVDTAAFAGLRTNPSFDSLLAKVIVHTPSIDVTEVVRRADRALAELDLAGVATNRGFLRALLRHTAARPGEWDTEVVDRHGAELVADAARLDEADAADRAGRETSVRDAPGAPRRSEVALPPGTAAVRAPLAGTVVSVEVTPGDVLDAGAPLVVLEAMKMQHLVTAGRSAGIDRVLVAPGDTVAEGDVVAVVAPREITGPDAPTVDDVDLDGVRTDLDESFARHAAGHDDQRPAAVARRHGTGHRTARENVADLCDAGSFVEYGALAIAAQRRRRSLEDLIANTPGDGMVAGVGTVNADRFGADRARTVVLSYDYMVLAGTQGYQNHRKKDRLFELAERLRLPVVLFAEGGGGRPGDTDAPGVSGLDCMAFHLFGKLSGQVPLVGIVSGRCFAGNAALAGCCDVLIATRDANLGMGGPAMIEGGGLGVFRPEEIGPTDVQTANGVIDVLVDDEAAAVATARSYLSYFQGSIDDWTCADQRLLRRAVPENRLRVYDVRTVIDTLADTDSVLELRRGFAPGMVTALARVEGRPIGIVANNPVHLAGAIDSDGADKAARFLQLCDAFEVPVLSLCDTPGIMVGPAAEATGLVRHASRLFVTGAGLTVPFFTIVLRKGYGLGAQAMAGGSFKAPVFCVAWPTGEFGGMGLEGAVRLGFRKELDAVEDADERQALYEEMVARAYEHGKGLNAASHFEIDDVIDPAESRRWIVAALESSPATPTRAGGKRPHVDTW
jgi:acetyl/propionyl-CoA carboxylase alpha subunit